MKYVSTRGLAPPVGFLDACLAGLAPDGGLYVPETWPSIAPAKTGEPYAEIAARILAAFAGGDVGHDTLLGMCASAYGRFEHAAVVPLVQWDSDRWILELHHGPTLAFKDVAMQIIAELFDHALEARGERMSVICATSGDTGGAAAAAFAGSRRVSLTILHPHQRISPVQRRFMTTTGAETVQNLAVDADFDACQAIVKALFADRALADAVNLSGVNSINWARIAAQSAYYAAAQSALGPDRPLRFVVPSGNMGDALAGYVAARCGLLAGFEAVCAVNENRALVDLLGMGAMHHTPARATPSPAMDISIPSNFERLLFEASGRDGEAVRTTYERFRQSGEASLPPVARGRLGCMGLSAVSVGNGATLEEIARIHGETGGLVCPHTAVGTHAARSLSGNGTTTVVLATAHAAKFPETVAEATGRHPALPDRVGDLAERAEVFDVVAADIRAVAAAVGALEARVR